MSSKCPPRWWGDGCDLPICTRGRLDIPTKTCICPGNFAPPFCSTCLEGFWGSECTNRPIKPEREPPSLSRALIPLIVALTVAVALAVIFILLIACRRRHQTLPKPPAYSVISSDAPPSYRSICPDA